MPKNIKILRLDASASPGQSSSQKIGDRLIEQLQLQQPGTQVRSRDLNRELSFIDSHWIAANFSPGDERDEMQRQRLNLSDQLIEEIEWADRIVLTTPMYNFGIPATLKTWIDHICRAGITFRYTENGPEGLLQNKRADIVITTGGAPLGSPVDFVSGYLQQVFGFIGIDEVNIIGADRMNVDADESFGRAIAKIELDYAAAAA